MWRELQRGAQRSLEVQLTAKVLQPIAAYLGEIEGIKKLHDQRQKRLMAFDCKCWDSNSGRPLPLLDQRSRPSATQTTAAR